MASESEIKSVSIKLDTRLHERLKVLAEARQRKPHFLMKEAIQQYLEREEKREAFRRDAILAWEEYQATGLHATAEEVDAWLAKLADGQDVEPPECHV